MYSYPKGNWRLFLLMDKTNAWHARGATLVVILGGAF